MKAGLGIRPELFEAVATHRPALHFLEAHSENYFGSSRLRQRLRELRERYPISLHGVGLSLGRADDLDAGHLAQLCDLAAEVEPLFVSEHLAWSAYSHRHVPDLLPLPLTDASLSVMCRHVSRMQEALGRRILVENPSNYLLFDKAQIPEPEFLNALASHTGCGLLVDVNNIYVSATNLGRDACAYIDSLDTERIEQFHLAGHAPAKDCSEPLLIDTHNKPVHDKVWELFAHAIERHGARPTLFEWDSDFPDFAALLGECEKADRILQARAATSARPSPAKRRLPRPVANVAIVNHIECPAKRQSPQPAANGNGLAALQRDFLDALLLADAAPVGIQAGHEQRLSVYRNNVFVATHQYLEELFPAVCGVVGGRFFKQMTHRYVRDCPPEQGDIHLYGADFAQVVEQFEGLRDVPYLSDLIAYEWAQHHAYFAPVKEALDPARLSREELLSLPIRLQAWLVCSEYPIYEIHRQSLPDYAGKVDISLDQSRDAILVYKREQQVICRCLNEEEKQFFMQLEKSDSLSQALAALRGRLPAEALSEVLAFALADQLPVMR